MNRTTIVLLTLAAWVALGTVLVGWWAVPVVALAAGVLLASRRRIAGLSALAAALGWLALLLWTAARGPLLAFAGKLAGAMGVPGFVPLLLTLLFPMLLAWAAAAVGQELRGLVARAQPSTKVHSP